MYCIHEQTDRDVTLTSSFPSSFSYYKAFFPRRSHVQASQFYTADLVLGLCCCLPAVCLIKWHRHISLSFHQQSFEPTTCPYGRVMDQCTSSSPLRYLVDLFMKYLQSTLFKIQDCFIVIQTQIPDGYTEERNFMVTGSGWSKTTAVTLKGNKLRYRKEHSLLEKHIEIACPKE